MESCILYTKTGKKRQSAFHPTDYGYPKQGRSLVYMHLCHNNKCSNPKHIKSDTRSNNVLDTDVKFTGNLKQYICGHLRTEENTYRIKETRWKPICGKCKICVLKRKKEYYIKNRERILKREKERYRKKHEWKSI